MSKSRSEKRYSELKAFYKDKASDKEKELHMDLMAVRHEYVPHHLKRKFLTGLGIFGTVYLVEKLAFGKKLPRIIRFTTSLSATIFAPRVYRMLEDKFLGIGELDPIEMEMLEDQQLSHEAVVPDSTVADDPYATQHPPSTTPAPAPYPTDDTDEINTAPPATEPPLPNEVPSPEPPHSMPQEGERKGDKDSK